MENLIRKTLGQYEISEKIGQGGMASVFKAYQPGLDRFVAIKVLSPALAQEAGFTERFQREAHSAARLHHPHILEVYDFGLENGYNYLVMRYVENSTTLGDLIQKGASLESLVDYIIQVADALNYAHERDIIHRDVKPSNILIDGRWALLADFGLAKIRRSSSQLTGTGVGIGTPAYMSPEQASGASIVDHRTDIYALGVILYRILTGTVPHEAPTPFAILAKRCSEPVRPAREINPNVPESLDQVVLRSLATEPDIRYSSATQFSLALQKAQGDPDYREDILATLSGPQDETAVVGEVARAAVTAGTAEGKTLPSDGVVVRRKQLGLIVGGAIASIVVVGVLLFFLLSYLAGNGGIFASSTPQVITPESAKISIPGPETEIPDTPTPSPETEVTDTPTPVLPGTPSALAKRDLEVRSGPGDGYELLGYLPAGASSTVVSRDQTGQWWQIKTSLGATGLGWIRAGADFSEATDTHNLPIALAPPTATPVPVPDTPTPAASPRPDTPTPTASPLPDTPTPTASPRPDTPTPTTSPLPDTPTSTASPLPDTPTSTASPLPNTPTRTRTPTPSRTRTSTPTRTRAPTPTRTRAPTLTRTRTPTPTRTRTPTRTSVPDTPTLTATSTRRLPTPTSAVPTRTPTLTTGQFTLLKPASIEEPSYGLTEFEWRWSALVGADRGFEVRVWREGETPAGVHNAVEDNKSGRIVTVGDGTYRLVVDISDAYGVQGRNGEYLWTVALVQISPEYKDLGIQAPPGLLRFEGGVDGGDEDEPSQPSD